MNLSLLSVSQNAYFRLDTTLKNFFLSYSTQELNTHTHTHTYTHIHIYIHIYIYILRERDRDRQRERVCERESLKN